MKKVIPALALTLSALAVAPASLAQDLYRAVASGPSEATPNPSPGYSISTFEINGTILTANIPFSDLTTPTVDAHLHCCTTDSLTGAAGVAIPLFGFPLGVTSGTYTQTFDLSDPAIYNPAFLTAFGGTATSAGAVMLEALADNRVYLNIHTEQYRGGEIRGFLVSAVPEPQSWAMLAAGLAGVGFMASRRRGNSA